MDSKDPIDFTEKISKIVVDGNKRKYYRFRGTRFYGGIATADCVGCNLNCRFCWSNRPRNEPEKVGNFRKPREVVEELVNISKKEGYSKVRISGNEPTIGREHLFLVLEELEKYDLQFVLETNGILIGSDFEYAENLSEFENLNVRVSLKGASPDHFSALTGMDKKGFELQLKALKNLVKSGCICKAAIIKDFISKKQLSSLLKRLEYIDPQLSLTLELEELKLYPHVKRRLQEYNLMEMIND